MIYYVATIVANPGKLPAMMDFSARAKALLNDKHGVETTVMRNVTGAGDEWHFASSHDSLAAFEAYQAAVASDEGFRALAMEATANALWSTNRSSLYRSVP